MPATNSPFPEGDKFHIAQNFLSWVIETDNIPFYPCKGLRQFLHITFRGQKDQFAFCNHKVGNPVLTDTKPFGLGKTNVPF